jgi:hypothetical protein
MADFDDLLCGGDDIEGDLDAIISSPIASTIPKWQMFKLLRWVQLLEEILYGGDDVEGDLDAIFLIP